jgi:hypothetical protein
MIGLDQGCVFVFDVPTPLSPGLNEAASFMVRRYLYLC